MLLHVGHDERLPPFKDLADIRPGLRRGRAADGPSRLVHVHPEPFAIADDHRDHDQAHGEAPRHVGCVPIGRLAHPALVRDRGCGRVAAKGAQPRQQARKRLFRLGLGGVGRQQLGDAKPLLQVPRRTGQLLRARHHDHRRCRASGHPPEFGQQREAVQPRQRQVGHDQRRQLPTPQHRLCLVAVSGDHDLETR
jgi:hypothetical protein